MFHLRRKICNNAGNSEIQAIVDPDTNELMFDKTEILKKTLQYASKTLQNNHPDKDFEKHFEAMKTCHEIRMKVKNTEENPEDDFTKEDFNREIKSLKDKYKELTEAGEGFKQDVYKFMKCILDSEEIPKSWDLTTLVQIFKKGDKHSLTSYT